MDTHAPWLTGEHRASSERSVAVVIVEAATSVAGWLARLPHGEASVALIVAEHGEEPMAFGKRARRRLDSLVHGHQRIGSVLLACGEEIDSRHLEARICLLRSVLRIPDVEIVLTAETASRVHRYQLDALALTLSEQGAQANIRVEWNSDAPQPRRDARKWFTAEVALRRAA